MSATSTFTVTVPATTANLGPGFDCIGAALSLYNSFQFSLLEPSATEKLKITVTGAEAAKVNTDESNLAYVAFVTLYGRIDRSPPPVAIHIDMQVPLARGLGSSATAIVGGLVGANELAGKPLSQVEVMQLAIELEGHPDNVVPALLGGCRLAASDAPPQPPLSKGGLRDELSVSQVEPELPPQPPLSKGGLTDELSVSQVEPELPPQPPLSKGGLRDELSVSQVEPELPPQPPLSKGGLREESSLTPSLSKGKLTEASPLTPPLTKGGLRDESPLTPPLAKGGPGGFPGKFAIFRGILILCRW